MRVITEEVGSKYGDLTVVDTQYRSSSQGALWSCLCSCGNSVFISGIKKTRLATHHINGWDNHRETRLDVDNGVTLCLSCHKAFHVLYGYGDNTEAQMAKHLTNEINAELFALSLLQVNPEGREHS